MIFTQCFLDTFGDSVMRHVRKNGCVNISSLQCVSDSDKAKLSLLYHLAKIDLKHACFNNTGSLNIMATVRKACEEHDELKERQIKEREFKEAEITKAEGMLYDEAVKWYKKNLGKVKPDDLEIKAEYRTSLEYKSQTSIFNVRNSRKGNDTGVRGRSSVFCSGSITSETVESIGALVDEVKNVAEANNQALEKAVKSNNQEIMQKAVKSVKQEIMQEIEKLDVVYSKSGRKYKTLDLLDVLNLR